MTNYYVDNTVSSDTPPQLLEITPTAVYVRKNVEELTETVDDIKRTYYRYTESKIAKDEYIESISSNVESLENLNQSLGATLALERLENLKKTSDIAELGMTVAKMRYDIMQLNKEG